MKTNPLHALARLYNVQTTYYDVSGRLNHSPAEGIIRVLRVLGAPVESHDDVPDALRERHQELWQRGLDPVLVAWDGGPLKFKLRLPRHLADKEARYQVELESGELRAGRCEIAPIAEPGAKDIEGVHYATHRLTLGQKLPFGYHRLQLDVGNRSFEAHLFASPVHAYTHPGAETKRWGLFAPVYALQSPRSLGAGDISDLESVVDWTATLGGAVVGTLPLLAAFLDELFNSSPYSPVSRLFWNEFYLDVTRIPELQACPAAREMLQSSGFQEDMERLRAAPLVDYRRLMALKRTVIEQLAVCVEAGPSERRDLFRSFIASHPLAEDYAAFRAKTELEGQPWQRWPEPNREGTLEPNDYAGTAKRYHLYAQWLAQEQMRALGERAKAGGPALYLDFPLGVHRDGYDVWRERAAFALDASGGAPPDGFFTKGQNWGFPPLHLEGLRRQGYRYFIHALRHHLRHCGMLRIDHVMGLHRLYWIPQGLEPTEGVYVRYPAEEFYAVLNLESHLHQAEIVGENLGTVPPTVNQEMTRHKMLGMYVGQFGIRADRPDALEPVPPATVVSLNTHDTPTFAGFWSGDDIRDRMDLGLLTESESAIERDSRAAQKAALARYLKEQGWLEHDAGDAMAVLKAWLCHLANGPAELVLVSLEDLWLEPLPQNVPGTWRERPNWQRKMRHDWEEVSRMESVAKILTAVENVRKQRR